MQRIRRKRNLQLFAGVDASVHTHFDKERHFSSRQDSKLNSAAALAEWHGLCSA